MLCELVSGQFSNKSEHPVKTAQCPLADLHLGQAGIGFKE